MAVDGKSTSVVVKKKEVQKDNVVKKTEETGDDKKKSVKKKSSYLDWERKFKAYAATKDFLPALQGRTNLPATYEDPETMPTDTEQEKTAKRAIVMNSMGMAFLHQAVESPKGIKMLGKAVTRNYPEGIAFEVMELMKNKFAKMDDLVAMELRRKLNKLTWDEKKNPSEFFEKLATIEMMSQKLPVDQLTESELCSQVFVAALTRHGVPLYRAWCAFLTYWPVSHCIADFMWLP